MKIATLFAAQPHGEGHAPCRPYVIAEAGVNHEGRLDTALALVDSAAEAGADAVKFQTYKAATLACKNSPAYWDTSKEPTKSQYELFSKYDALNAADYETLKRRCDDAGVEFLSTPFDLESARFLAPLVPAFKLASADIANKPLISALAASGKPLLISTGASHLYEIARALSWLPDSTPLCLLHCVLNYPTPDEHAALMKIPALARHFPQAVIGYSDHTLPADMQTLVTATLLGARVLEKHFTLDKTLPGNDHYHAMDAADLRHFRQRMDAILSTLGDGALAPLPSEAPARIHARRSLVAARALEKGHVLTADDLICKRPGQGISPACIDQVLGMRARGDIAEDTILTWNLLE